LVRLISHEPVGEISFTRTPDNEHASAREVAGASVRAILAPETAELSVRLVDPKLALRDLRHSLPNLI
jgi:hypothetical protein